MTFYLSTLIGLAEHKWEDNDFQKAAVKKAAGIIIVITLKCFPAGDANFKVIIQ